VDDQTKPRKTMNEIASFTGLLILLAVLVVGILAVLMPVFVFVILGHVSKISDHLAAMEHMMRHGK
jgi:hypothetical protein